MFMFDNDDAKHLKKQLYIITVQHIMFKSIDVLSQEYKWRIRSTSKSTFTVNPK